MSVLLESMRRGDHPIMAMIQVPALPGSAQYRGQRREEMLSEALHDADVAAEAGVDGLMIQNLGDLPVGHRVTPLQVAWMMALAAEVKRTVPIPLGLNFLENDAEAMLSVASAIDLDFVRLKVFVGVMVTPFGLVEGCAHAAVAARKVVSRDDIAFFTDVHDRTGIPLGGRPLIADVREAVDLGGADALVLTGSSFDESVDFLSQTRQRFPEVPRILGGSSDVSNLATSWTVADGIMVSSSLKDTNQASGRFVREKARIYMEEVRRLRVVKPERLERVGR